MCLNVVTWAEETEVQETRAVTGFADTHIHQMTEYAFGGGWLYGKHDGPIDEVLSRCSGGNDHGFLAGEGLLGIHLFRRGGYPKFDGWPLWDSKSHQQVYADWLKKAHDDGLNLIVMSAVNFEPLAQIIPEKHKVKEWGYKDIPALKRQINAAWRFAAKHDWYEIALSPSEARRIILEGKLAVVLAIESSDSFGEEELVEQFDEFYDMGVRSMQLCHQFNNRFCGAAPHHQVFYIFQYIRDLMKESDKELARELLYNELIQNYKVRGRSDLPVSVQKGAEEFLAGTLGFDFDKNGKNILGLTKEGRTLVEKMIEKNMILDIAHISERSVKEVFDICKKNDYYPIMVSHGHLRDVMIPEKAKEEKTTPTEFIPMIMETGGIFGLRTGKEEVRTYKYSGVENTCAGTNRAFAQMYQYAVKELGLTVAFACDMNGFIEQLKPRFGDHHDTKKGKKGCPDHGKRWEKGVGTDFDTKGFAHVGYMGDILKDLNNLGVDTSPMEGSAEKFLQMWERTYDENRQMIPYNVDLEKARMNVLPYKK